jgi:hypothetical protein
MERNDLVASVAVHVRDEHRRIVERDVREKLVAKAGTARNPTNRRPSAAPEIGPFLKVVAGCEEINLSIAIEIERP